jgi:hypothetical protein
MTITTVLCVATIAFIVKPLGWFIWRTLELRALAPHTRTLRNRYASEWSFDDGVERKCFKDKIRVFQFGSLVWAKARSDTHRYRIWATMGADGYLHGKLREQDRSHDCYGSFKLKVGGRGAAQLTGKWIGKSERHGAVQAGDWVWTALTEDAE